MTALSAVTCAAIAALAMVRRPVSSLRAAGSVPRRPLRELWPLSAVFGVEARHRPTALADALDAMCRHLRAGQSVPSALSGAANECRGPIAVQWHELVSAVSNGTDLGDAVRAWGTGASGRPSLRRPSSQRPRSDEALAAAAISIGVAFGGPRADAIEAVAQTLRERASLGEQLRGFAAQARLSAMVITLAPLLFASLTIAGDEASRDVMLGSIAGRVCLVAGVTLDAIGWWWMGRIAAHAAGPAS